MRRIAVLLATLTCLGACASGERQLSQPVEPIGDFKLGFAEVVAPNLVKGPLSREATQEDWIAAVDVALEQRFGRYSGDKFYHLGVSVEAYVLAQPGVPLVFSPKSALIARVTVWDDATQTKLNAETHQVTVLESFSAETVVGSGLTQSAEEQMRGLSANLALQIENWMRRQNADPEVAWFGAADGNTVQPPQTEDLVTATEEPDEVPLQSSDSLIVPEDTLRAVRDAASSGQP